MRLTTAAFAALLVLSAVVSPLAAQAQLPPDFAQPQSPPKPAPEWLRGPAWFGHSSLKMIDQGQFDPRLKGYLTPEGIKVEIVAEHPAVTNPVGMIFANDGTPFVLEWRTDTGPHFKEHPEVFTYKDGSKRTVATMKKRTLDCVKVLSDTNGDGIYDKGTVVLEDELPSSILLYDGWLYLSGRGTVRRYRQSKPGGPYDIKEVIAQGFCGFHHHQVSGLTLGNDGWLYITSGDDDNFVEGSDGSRATVLRTGAVFRCRPDGSHMQAYAMGFRNPYRDVAFDTAYNMFHTDNDNEDGSKFMGCRLMHIAEGSDFGWRLFTGARCCRPDPIRGAIAGELPGKVPAMLKTGRGAPAGLLIYNDTRFPEPYRGLLIYPDVFRKSIRAYKVAPKGATFEVAEEFEFMTSGDDLFRPCHAVLGPDGAIYIVDWRTNSGGAGQLWGDGKHGRVYRLTWAGTKDSPALPRRGMESWQKVIRSSDDGLLAALASPDFSDREKARQELVQRGPRNNAALRKLLENDEQPQGARIAALGALESCWDEATEKLFITLLRDRDADIRRLVAEGLGLNARQGDRDVHDALLHALNDPEPAVRRAVILAMSRVAAPGSADVLVNTLAFDDGKDVYLQDGILRGLERLGAEGMDRLLALAESGNAGDLAKVVNAFTSFRDRPAGEALPRLLKNPHLSIAQRAALLRSYTNYLLDPPLPVEPVLKYVLDHPDEALDVSLAGLEALGVGEGLKSEKAQEWVVKLLEEDDPATRLKVITIIENARVTKAVAPLVRILVDPARPTTERTAAGKALRVLGNQEVAAALKNLALKEESDQPDAVKLRVEAFRSLATLDPAAAQQTAVVLLTGKERALQTEAMQVISLRPEGAKKVGELFLGKKLPRELLPQVAEALRRHADKDKALGDMLTAVMKTGLLIANDPAEVERIRQFVASKGNPERGKSLFLNSKALACVTCHRLEGIGGNIGPDLTRMWDTHSVEKVLESMLEPSKEIKEGYSTYVASTKKGLTYQGLKIAQTPEEVVIRESNGQDVRIPTKDLEELELSKVSLMPEGVIAQLSYDEFIDLVAFLKSRSAQESLRGLVLDYSVVGPFASELKTPFPPEEKPDPTAAYPGSKPGEKLMWQARQADANGQLVLKDLFKEGPGSAYALTFIHSPADQLSELRVGSGSPVRVWVNKELAHEADSSGSTAPEGERVKVHLQKGWNAVLVKLLGSKEEPRLSLRIVGNGLRTARLPVE